MLIVVVLAAVWAEAAETESLDLSVAINKAGLQRMLTQRIVKAYCLAGLGNENRAARAQIHIAIELFEAQLAEFSAFAQSPGVGPALARVRRIWMTFEPLAGGEITRQGARRLLALDTTLLEAAQGLVAALRNLSKGSGARLVDISGRQRMLSQRLVKAYLFLAWGLDTPAVHKQFVETWGEFESALSELRSSPANTPAISRELDLAAEQWQWLQSALSLHQDGNYFPGIVDDASEKTLLIMERVTALYEQLAAQSQGGNNPP